MTTLNHPKTEIFFSSSSLPSSRATKTITNPCVVHSPKFMNLHKSNKLRTRCTSLKSSLQAHASGSAAEALPEVEVDFEEEECGGWKEKCKERRGLVEVLECLEREAIMGEDEGKEPSDYNRRAHIFDKSSRVFQALKDSNNSSSNLSAPKNDD